MRHTICSVVVCCSLIASLAMADNSDYLNFLERGRSQYRDGKLAEAEASLIAAIKTLERSDYSARAVALKELGDVYVVEDKLVKAEQVYGESLKLSEKLADRNRVPLLLRHLGAVYSLEGREDEALQVLQRALKLAKTNHDAGLGS